MGKPHKRLGDLLVEANCITPQDLADAIVEQRRTGELLGATLIRMGVLSEQSLTGVLQTQLGLAFVDLQEEAADEQALALIKEEVARKYVALPLRIEGRSTLVVAMADPLNVAALEDLRFHSGMFLQPVLALPSAILDSIERYYHIDRSMNEVISNIVSTTGDVHVEAVREDDRAQAIDELMKEAEGRPIVRLTNWMLHRAVEERASDLHIEPQDRHLTVRFRIDGLLHEIQKLPKWTQGAVVSRIKVLSNLDIAEKRQPQDGRLAAEIRGRRIDMRVSTLPTTHGEKVVIRIVDQARTTIDLDDLGLHADDLAHVRRDLERPQGILLVTGPTGSGKSTLLYACLRQIQHETKNIVTVEDPVEYHLPGINQVHVDEKAKKTFPAALRAILRQDPDVIMVGEIRDKETAQIAFRASVTGHLVLSTVHTNDAAGAVTRLIDLGLEPFMVASSLISVVSMRLVRTLCPKCRESYEVPASNLNRLGAPVVDSTLVQLSRGRGCPHCRETGYQGRTGIFEMLEVTDSIRQLINQGAPDALIRHAAIEGGMRSIGEDGLRKVMAGVTTLDEVTRVVYLVEAETRICPTCHTVCAREFDYCPSCGDYVGEHCEGCHRRVHPQWAFCPACGEPTRAYADLVKSEEFSTTPRPISERAQRRLSQPIERRAA
jgi:type IV pilus assembly protein PilB